MKVNEFHNRHRDKNLFILASGPSLDELDVTPLSRRITMGLNRSFLKYPEPYYHCVFDHRLFDLYKEQLKKCRILFTLEGRPFGTPINLLGSQGFSYDLEQGIYSGYTISYFALQLAVYMGFKRIIFLGLDLKLAGDKTHFFGYDYHSKDHDSTEFPKMIKAFESVAQELLEEKGIEIYNCSRESGLTCFPYLSYEDAIKF